MLLMTFAVICWHIGKLHWTHQCVQSSSRNALRKTTYICHALSSKRPKKICIKPTRNVVWMILHSRRAAALRRVLFICEHDVSCSTHWTLGCCWILSEHSCINTATLCNRVGCLSWNKQPKEHAHIILAVVNADIPVIIIIIIITCSQNEKMAKLTKCSDEAMRMSRSLRSESVSHGVSSMQSSMRQREYQCATKSVDKLYNTYTCKLTHNIHYSKLSRSL